MKELVYEVVWPRGKQVVEGIRLGNRLDTLEGKTVGFLWDWAFRGNEMFPVIEQELAKRYPGIKFVGYDVFGTTEGGKVVENIASLPDKLRQYKCDAVISGVGC